MFLPLFIQDIVTEKLLHANKLCCPLSMDIRRSRPYSQETHSLVGKQGL